MKHLKYFLIALVSFILNACLKVNFSKAKCEGNCVTTTFKGRIYDATNSKGFPNIKVRAIWSDFSQSYLYPEIDVVRTDSYGWFEFKAEINPDYFRSKTLSIQFEAPTGYELRSNLDGNNFFSDESFSDYNSSSFQQIDFKLYPVTTAKIRFIRTQTDTIKKFDLLFNFNNEYPTGFGYQFQNFNSNYEYTIITSADIYTRITMEKTLLSGSKIIISDSAIFKRNQSNLLETGY